MLSAECESRRRGRSEKARLPSRELAQLTPKEYVRPTTAHMIQHAMRSYRTWAWDTVRTRDQREAREWRLLERAALIAEPPPNEPPPSCRHPSTRHPSCRHPLRRHLPRRRWSRCRRSHCRPATATSSDKQSAHAHGEVQGPACAWPVRRGVSGKERTCTRRGELVVEYSNSMML